MGALLKSNSRSRNFLILSYTYHHVRFVSGTKLHQSFWSFAHIQYFKHIFNKYYLPHIFRIFFVVKLPNHLTFCPSLEGSKLEGTLVGSKLTLFTF